MARERQKIQEIETLGFDPEEEIQKQEEEIQKQNDIDEYMNKLENEENYSKAYKLNKKLNISDSSFLALACCLAPDDTFNSISPAMEVIKNNNQSINYSKLYNELSLEEDYKINLSFCLRHNNYDDKPVDIMKNIVKAFDGDTAVIIEAVKDITNCKGESPIFMSKLLNDTLKTEEYKQVFAKERGKSQEISR